MVAPDCPRHVVQPELGPGSDLNVLNDLNDWNGWNGPAVCYLNSDITFSANSRMFFSDISCGKPK